MPSLDGASSPELSVGAAIVTYFLIIGIVGNSDVIGHETSAFRHIAEEESSVSQWTKTRWNFFLVVSFHFTIDFKVGKNL